MTITVSDTNGVKQFDVPNNIKKIVISFLVIIALVITGLSFYVKKLNDKLVILEKNIDTQRIVEKEKIQSQLFVNQNILPPINHPINIKKEKLEKEAQLRILKLKQEQERLAKEEEQKKIKLAKIEKQKKEALAKAKKEKEAKLAKLEKEKQVAKLAKIKLEQKAQKLANENKKKAERLAKLEKLEKTKKAAKLEKAKKEKESLAKKEKLAQEKKKKAKLAKEKAKQKKKILAKAAKNKNYSTYKAFKKNVNLRKSFKVFKDKKLLTKANGKNTHIKIDVSEQRIKLLVNGKIALDAPCTTGAKHKFEPNTKTYRDKHTPLGTYKIMEKITAKKSTIFGEMYRNGKKVYHGDRRKYKGPKAKYIGHTMHNWMRLTSGGIGLHASKYVKRYPGSNGCIRIQPKIAKVIFNKVRKGTKVSVIN